MAQSVATRFMDALARAEDARDADLLVGVFAPDAELTSVAHPDPEHGRDGARRFWHHYLGAFGHIHSEFTAVIEAPHRAVLEWVSEGALPSGQPIRYRGVSILEWDEDAVKRFRTYYDSAVFLPRSARTAQAPPAVAAAPVVPGASTGAPGSPESPGAAAVSDDDASMPLRERDRNPDGVHRVR